jgi:hypothetical protein
LASCLSDFAGLGSDRQAPRDTVQTPPQPKPVRVARVVIYRDGPDTLASLGDSVEYSAEALDSAGHVIAGRHITWMSDTAIVADTDPFTGLTVAQGNGVTTIRAGADGVWAVDTIAVRQRISKLVLVPDQTKLDMHETDVLSAVARDPRGNVVIRPAGFAWNSSRPLSVAVTPSPGDPSQASITRKLTGRTTITVSAEGKSASARID